MPREDPRTYPAAVRRLADTDGPLPVADVLSCFFLRDSVARRFEDGRLTDRLEAEAVLVADETLEGLGSRLAAVEELVSWRKRFTPPPSSWWWYPAGSVPWPQRVDGLWSTLTLVFLAFTISIATDLVRRFNLNGIDLRGAFFVVLPTSLAALSAGSLISESLRTHLEELYRLLTIPVPWRHLTTLVLVVLLFFVVSGIWFCLPTIARGYSDRGAEAFQQGRLKDAQTTLQRAIQLDPSNTRAHYNLGSVYEELLLPAQAKVHYQIAFTAGDLRASNNLGRIFILEGKPDQAVQVLLRAQDQVQERTEGVEAKTSYDILKNLAWARLEQKRFNEAWDRLSEAVEFRPGAAAAHCLLGKLYMAQGKEDLAKEEWEVCLGANPLVLEEETWIAEARAFLARLDAGGA